MESVRVFSVTDEASTYIIQTSMNLYFLLLFYALIKIWDYCLTVSINKEYCFHREKNWEDWKLKMFSKRAYLSFKCL